MAGLVLRKFIKSQLIDSQKLGDKKNLQLSVEKQAVYQVIDEQTGKRPSKLVLVRKGQALCVLVDNVLVLEVVDFYKDPQASDAALYLISDQFANLDRLDFTLLGSHDLVSPMTAAIDSHLLEGVDLIWQESGPDGSAGLLDGGLDWDSSTLLWAGLGLLGGAAGAGIAVGMGGGSSHQDNTAANAIARLSQFAQANSLGLAKVMGIEPSVTDYSEAGLTGVNSNNLKAINDALAGSVIDGAKSDTAAELQAIVDAYNAILNEANGATADTTVSNPTLSQYLTLGVNLDKTGLSLLNDVIGGKQSVDVDTIAEINALARIVNAIDVLAAGGTVNPPLTIEDFTALGLSGLNDGNINPVLSAIAATKDDGSEVDSLSKLQSLINHVPDLQIINTINLGVVYQGVTVIAIDDQGHEIGRQSVVANLDGNYVLNINAKGWGDYRGAILVQVLDSNGLANNFIDEATGAPKDISTTLRALVLADDSNYQTDVDGNKKLMVNITPLTEMAVQLVEKQTNQTYTDQAPSYALADAANTSVAVAFGLVNNGVVQDITGPAIVVNVDQFNAADGLSESEAYGVVLAKLSGVDNLVDGSINNTIERLIANIEGQGNEAKLSVYGQLLMIEGSHKVLNNLGNPNTPDLNDANKALFGYSTEPSTAEDIAIDEVAKAVQILKDTKQQNNQDTNVSSSVIKVIVDDYNAILAEANGANPDATSTNPSVKQYASIGVKGVDAGAEETLLGNIIGTKVKTEVDTIAEIQALADAVAVTVAYTGANGQSGPSVSELGLLVTGVTAQNLAVVQAAIAQANSDGTPIATQAELQKLVDEIKAAAAALYGFAEANSSGLVNATGSAPSLDDYSHAGVAGVDANNINAINDALASSVISSAKADTPAGLQAIVDAYNAILAEANGASSDATATDPTAAQYAAMGVTGVDAGAEETLLGDIIGNRATTAVDTIAELQALADAVASTVAYSAASGQTGPSVSELGLLVTDVTAQNLAAVQAAIAQANGDGSAIATQVELQALVDGINAAAASLGAFAEANSTGLVNATTGTAPTLTDYSHAGVTGVDANNLSSINDALSSSVINGAKADTPAELQAIVDAYNAILAEANGSATDATLTDPTAADYAAIGVVGVDAGAEETLLGDIISNRNQADVDTVTELQALADAVASTVAYSATSGQTGPSVSELGLLVTDVTAQNLAAVQAAIAQANGDGSAIATQAELQALVDGINAAAASLGAFAAANSTGLVNATGTAPTLTDYSHAGVTGVDATNLDAINDALASSVINGVKADTPVELQVIVDAYNAILAEANGASADATATDPTAADYAAIGGSVWMPVPKKPCSVTLSATAPPRRWIRSLNSKPWPMLSLRRWLTAPRAVKPARA